MLQSALAKTYVDYKELSRIIGTSPSLTARLLSVANSAIYGFKSQVSNIDQAISLLGTHRLAEQVLAAEVIHAIKHTHCSLFPVVEFCKHSLGCGVAARCLAQNKQQRDVDAYFAMGLLHDIGRLVFCTKMPEQQLALIEVNKQENIPLCVLEQQQYGYSHDEVGSALLKRWQLPEMMVVTTQNHHSPLASSAHGFAASVVHVADWITHQIPLGFNGEHFVPVLDQGALSLLRFEEAGLSPVVDETKRQFNDYAKLLI